MSHSNLEHNHIKETMNHSLGKFNFLKKVSLQILLSITLFSLLYYQSSIVPILVESFDYYFSDFSNIKIFTYKTERNYIFLLCNGILVLIIQISGVISKIPPVNSIIEGTSADQYTEKKADILVKRVEFVEEIKGREINEDVILIEEAENGDEDYKSDVENDDDDDDNDEQEWEEADGLVIDEEELTADELHKKFEDFIKKVKQEIHSETFHN